MMFITAQLYSSNGQLGPDIRTITVREAIYLNEVVFNVIMQKNDEVALYMLRNKYIILSKSMN